MPCIVKPYNMLSNIRNFVAVDVFFPSNHFAENASPHSTPQIFDSFLISSDGKKNWGRGDGSSVTLCSLPISRRTTLLVSKNLNVLARLSCNSRRPLLSWGEKFKARLEKAFLPLNKRLRFSPSLCGKLFVDVCLFCCSCRRSP